VKVIVNGTPHDVEDGASVATCVTLLTTATTGVAAAVNGEVVRRSSWALTPVRNGDLVEVITAVQGG
jgi:sulfur carrier protein